MSYGYGSGTSCADEWDSVTGEDYSDPYTGQSYYCTFNRVVILDSESGGLDAQKYGAYTDFTVPAKKRSDG